jgi:hypothetical protein
VTVVGITVFACILLVKPVTDALLPDKVYTTPLINKLEPIITAL